MDTFGSSVIVFLGLFFITCSLIFHFRLIMPPSCRSAGRQNILAVMLFSTGVMGVVFGLQPTGLSLPVRMAFTLLIGMILGLTDFAVTRHILSHN